jgi:hypothetical protein
MKAVNSFINTTSVTTNENQNIILQKIMTNNNINTCCNM